MTHTSFRVQGLNPSLFRRLYGLSDAQLAAENIVRSRVDAFPGFPDRVGMRDMEPGETALLLNFEHLPVESRYRSCHAIFVCEGAEEAFAVTGEVPDVLKRRIVSLRGFDVRGFIVDADLAEGDGIELLIRRLFENPAIDYIHAHYAKRGCFAGLIERA